MKSCASYLITGVYIVQLALYRYIIIKIQDAITQCNLPEGKSLKSWLSQVGCEPTTPCSLDGVLCH